MAAFYNEHDPGAAAWLRELIREKLITEGTVDERDIQQLQPADLSGYARCHFFGGIGGWDYALALAGWPAARPVWTGSCPCQPFSAAGKGKGEEDERHLWPAWLALVRECRPDCLFGEQVASRDGYRWLDGVRTDLEAEGYTFGAADLPAASAGAPHVRQRLWWVASLRDASGQRLAGREVQLRQPEHGGEAVHHRSATGRPSSTCDSPNAGEQRRERRQGEQGSGRDAAERGEASGDAGDGSGVGYPCYAGSKGPQERIGDGRIQPAKGRAGAGQAAELRSDSGHWDAFDLINYRDGKTRRVEPGTFPLAHGVPARLVKLRGYGNAIVPQTAAKFIKAFLEAEAEQ